MSAEGALRDGNTADFELIETMRWEPGEGFLRFDRHLARLYGSAGELGFACDPQRVGEVLMNTRRRTEDRPARPPRPVAQRRRDGLGSRL